ncbi:PIR Superfamily Protein [Plasmodium ovale wallikeri]|uniref:PIR Superfamily Protein n=1 Tax=Plasmodium ovale wallikeri TaxID=864142 RepID=A0A1A9AKU3_PLAOA|nr:PIR Superfamily Protein [Plasmodium ovale wallikeri]
MTKGKILDDLPSKKYKNELENGIHYQEAEKNMERDKLTINVMFWQTTLPGYLYTYINDHMNEWSENNNKKRCRDLNHILDLILKKIKEKLTDSSGSYDLIEQYINKAAEAHLKPWGSECERKSKLPDDSDYIENMKSIDDLCEDIAYINENISKIHSNYCKKIEGYIDQQITKLNSIYEDSPSKYSDILGHYGFTSFSEINTALGNFKSKCKEGTTGASLVDDQGGMQQYSGRNASIVAITSLSGILSSALLLYKTTPFGSIMNNIIQKKIKFGNNLNEKIDYETLEEIPESSHNGSYNILYNTVGDS